MHKFSDNVKYDVGRMLNSVSVSTSTSATVTTGTSVDMRYYNNFVGLVGGAVGAGASALTAYITEATFATGVFNQAKPLATAAIASATSPYTGYGGSVEVRAEQMSDGHRFLRVEVKPTSGTGNRIAIANLRFNSRYPQHTLPT